LLNESYMTLVICCLVNIEHISWSSTGEIVESVTAILFLVALILFPVVEGLILVLNFEVLKDEDVE